MAHSRRLAAGIAALTSTALLLAACSGESEDPAASGSDGGGDAQVTLTWWHNGTGEPLNGYWQSVADAFMAENPNVTVDVQAYQNEELQRTLIPNALRSNDPPDLFQQWGAGELAAQVEAGYIMDVTGDVADIVDGIAAVSPWQIDGKTYGLPFSFGIEGFWYNTELFDQAGITETPETLDDLYDAIDALKAADITPIAVGAGDSWPAAHYWYNFALKACSPATLEAAQANLVFDDPCFVDAGTMLQEFLDSEPFQEGYLATSAQQGAGSSAGLLANGNAAMELMGHWNPGVMGGLTESGEIPEFLGWFNFPSIPGSAGDPTAVLGGGDGFSCSAGAPPECVDLLRFISSVDNQIAFGETGAGVPVTMGSEDAVDPILAQVLEGRNSATYTQMWLDTAYGPNVGGAMNDGITNMFAGQATPEDIVQGMQDAAANQ